MAYIFGDVIIIENFIMNSLILLLTAHFSKKKINLLRIALGAIIGAIYTILIYIPSMNFLNQSSMKICLSILIIVVVFAPYKFKDFIRSFAIFYLISFIFGGIAFALIYLTRRGGLSSRGFFYVLDFPVSLLFLSCLIGLISINFSWKYIQRIFSKDDILISLYIYIENKKIETIGLFDTANFLSDPLTNLPVIIVEYHLVESILPEEIQEIFLEHPEIDFELISNRLLNSNWMNRFRMIPYSTIGKENGLLIGFKTDTVTIFNKKWRKEIDNVIMAIYKHKLSKNGEYYAILHPEILNTHP